MVAFTVFIFVGALDNIGAMPLIVGRVFRWAERIVFVWRLWRYDVRL